MYRIVVMKEFETVCSYVSDDYEGVRNWFIDEWSEIIDKDYTYQFLVYENGVELTGEQLDAMGFFNSWNEEEIL